MRKPDFLMLLAGCLFCVATLAAGTESAQPPSDMGAAKKPLKPVPDFPASPPLETRERHVPLRNAAPRASRIPSKTLLPQLDEKHLGLGCAQP